MPLAIRTHNVFLYFSDKTISSNVKIDSLMFLNVLLTSHTPEVFHPYINAIVPVSNHSVH